MGEPILSICIVTMNRADQLKEALESCLACQLPAETEFVILDNASQDATAEVVNAVLGKSGYAWVYERSEINLGVGGGRARVYDMARGQYIYCMDDDAVIDVGKNPDFFLCAIEIFKSSSKIATITTQIYDLAWGRNRVEIQGKPYTEGVYRCKMFCGGSHFLRKSAFAEQPYLQNQYGYEELLPSLRVADMGCVNAFCPELRVEHRPRIDKWDRQNEKNHALVIDDCAIPYAIKKMMYPCIFHPLLWLAFNRRCAKHLGAISGGKTQARAVVRSMMHQYPIKYKLKVKTVLHLFCDFGIAIF